MQAQQSMLQLTLPEEISTMLKSMAHKAYCEAVEQARRDVSITKTIFTVEEVCDLLNISRNTLTSYFDLGLVRSKINNRIYVRKHHLDDFLDKHEEYL